MLSLLKNTILGLEIAIFALLFFLTLMCVMEKDWLTILILIVIMVINRLVFKKIRKIVQRKINEKNTDESLKKWRYETGRPSPGESD